MTDHLKEENKDFLTSLGPATGRSVMFQRCHETGTLIDTRIFFAWSRYLEQQRSIAEENAT